MSQMRNHVTCHALTPLFLRGTPLPLRVIAKFVGMRTPVAVSQTVRRLEQARRTNRPLNDWLVSLMHQCREW